ncbi:MAG: hypothetical protein K5923_00120 [Clostridia bacterium]|nr:hypothetical protein [Clostridia bacterium]
MKKRDEIEEEILDEDEILEDEEVLDDDEEILDDEDVIDDEEDDEFEDERPAKKGKAVKKPASGKGGKKKLSKGAIAGISIGSVVAFLAIAVVLVVFVILPMMGAKLENAEYQGIIGNTKPTGFSSTKEVNKNMTALEMLNIALENYDTADYAANICLRGGVATKIGKIAVNQGVQSWKIRVGKATDSNVKYFARSISYGFTNMAEEYYTENLSTGPIKYRGLDGKVKEDENGNQIVKGWGKTESYTDLDDYIEHKATDFTKIWSYEVTDKTVTKESQSAKPTKSGDCFTFKIVVDVTNPDAIEGYKKVMEYQLAENMGANGVSIDFQELSFDIGVWENGLIRYIGITESYVMNLTLGALKVNGIAINNSYMNEYSYDKTEAIPYEGQTLKQGEFFKLFS